MPTRGFLVSKDIAKVLSTTDLLARVKSHGAPLPELVEQGLRVYAEQVLKAQAE